MVEEHRDLPPGKQTNEGASGFTATIGLMAKSCDVEVGAGRLRMVAANCLIVGAWRRAASRGAEPKRSLIREETHRQERVSTECEEIVLHADDPAGEEFAPELDKGRLCLVARGGLRRVGDDRQRSDGPKGSAVDLSARCHGNRIEREKR